MRYIPTTQDGYHSQGSGGDEEDPRLKRMFSLAPPPPPPIKAAPQFMPPSFPTLSFDEDPMAPIQQSDPARLPAPEAPKSPSGYERFEKFANSPTPEPIDWSGEPGRAMDTAGTGGFDPVPPLRPEFTAAPAGGSAAAKKGGSWIANFGKAILGGGGIAGGIKAIGA